MQCPLYKRLKQNGTSFYAFPGAAEDISAAYQNSNYKMYFSKYVLLDLPVQNLSEPGGTMSEYIYWDFATFSTLSATQPLTFGEQVIESLRNYVANHEITIRESRLNNTEYYYDNTALETTAEKIFFKWCKKLGILSLEPALPQDEYFDNLSEFERRNVTDDSYFREYLWKERDQNPYTIKSIEGSITYQDRQVLQMTVNGISNFRAGDIVQISNIIASTVLYEEIWGPGTTEWLGDIKVRVLEVTTDVDDNHVIVLDFDSNENITVQTEAYTSLVYHKLVRYIGEVNGISNVQEANKAYTEVYAHVPDHTGQTPDILFRTIEDVNYKPGMVFPIIPNQYQPEIIGAELFSSPIVSNPQNYPGSYYGQFDTEDYTYELSNGDSLRRSGDYYGVTGDINVPVVNGSTVDGLILDFDTAHYVKMNLPDRSLSNFDQFNALEINNLPPKDFEFNAILWYYTVEDSAGNKKTNLYGISLLDNPDNNPKDEEIGLKFPTYRKLVTNGSQDGTSYQFILNLNFNIINDNPQQAYNPEAINSLFSMNLFNQAMSRLSATNDSFLNLINEQGVLKDQVDALKQLLYTQTDISTINAKISNLENLLRLYSTNQIVSSNSIDAVTNPGTPVTISLYNKETSYSVISNIKTTDLYSSTGIIPLNYSVPTNKNFLLNIVNNDEVNLTLSNNDKLTIVLSNDLDYKQSVDILITGTPQASQNKKLDIYIDTTIPSTTTTSLTTTQALLIGDIDLPIFYNNVSSLVNSAYLWSDFKFDIDFNQTIQYTLGNVLEVPLSGNQLIINNSIKVGDTLMLNNLFVGTSSVFNFSGQYKVDSLVGSTSSYIRLNLESNPDFIAYGSSASLPLYIHGTNSTMLSNKPYFSLNKGKKIKITRINSGDVSISEKYQIEVQDIK